MCHPCANGFRGKMPNIQHFLKTSGLSLLMVALSFLI
jgi:hypothetical protein